MLKPDNGFLSIGWATDADQVELVLTFITGGLANAFHILSTVEVDKFSRGCEWTQRETFIEFAFHNFDFYQLNNTLIIHIGHMIVAIHSKIRTWYYLTNLEEVESF